MTKGSVKMLLPACPKSPMRGRSRYYLRILTALTCGVFVFVFYFVNGVQQQVKLQVDVENAAAVAAAEYRPRCVWPIYWAGQSSKYTVLYNYVPADTVFEYNASVTYTTHGTNRFLMHAEQIARRWNGPVSLAVYAPASDFEDSLQVIQYLRQCGSPYIRQLTTFHLFFDAIYKPVSIPCSLDDAVPTVDCDTFVFPNRTFQAQNNLTYPVNVARNIARISAQTRYVLPSDIELYPSVNLIPTFLEMVAKARQEAEAKEDSGDGNGTATTGAGKDGNDNGNKDGKDNGNEDGKADGKDNVKKDGKDNVKKDGKDNGNKDGKDNGGEDGKDNAKKDGKPDGKDIGKKDGKKTAKLKFNERTVFVLPIFEVDESLPAPENKTELLALLAKEKVVPFHKFVCPECHRVPKQDEWLKRTVADDTMGVLYSTKRHKPFHNWEPIYIGTNDEPLYDERLNWEGMSDKMTQAYEMCLLDYNFSILDNAFLVHAPGIKRYNKTLSSWRKGYVTENSKLRKQIKKELTSKYAPDAKCSL